MNNFFDAFKSNILIYSLIKQIPAWYYLFIFFILYSNRRVEIICFFIFNLIIYFSINPNLWGLTKYVLEYGVPFFLVGHFIFTKLLIDKKKYLLAYLINIFIIFLNIYDFYKFPISNISGDLILDEGVNKLSKNKDKDTKYVLKVPYSYDKAYAYIKKKGATNNTLMLGTTYGFLPEIIENYNYKELINVLNLRNSFDEIAKANYSLSKRMMELNKQDNLKDKIIKYLDLMKKVNIIKSTNTSDHNISQSQKELNKFSKLKNIKNLKYLMIADYGNKNNIKKILLSNNWVLEKTFLEIKYRSTLFLFKKIE